MGDRLATIDMGRKLGAVPFLGESWAPFNTMWPGPRPIFVPSGILIQTAQPFWHNRHSPTIGGLYPFLGGGLGPNLSQCNVAWADAYVCIKCHLDPSSRLATTDVGRKLGDSVPFWGREERGPHLTQCRLR